MKKKLNSMLILSLLVGGGLSSNAFAGTVCFYDKVGLSPINYPTGGVFCDNEQDTGKENYKNIADVWKGPTPLQAMKIFDFGGREGFGGGLVVCTEPDLNGSCVNMFSEIHDMNKFKVQSYFIEDTSCKSEPVEICFYQHSRGNGDRSCYTKPAHHNELDVAWVGLNNHDDWSSVAIYPKDASGTLTVYEYANFKGKSKEITPDMHWFFGKEYNDMISSFKYSCGAISGDMLGVVTDEIGRK